MSTDHPCVVTINHRSKPRILFSGDQLVEVDLPVGSRVIYAKPPMEPLADVPAAIRYAINHPENAPPLYSKLRPGMKVTVAIDDLSMPLPPMATPDVRQQMLEVVLEELDKHAVTDIDLIVATAFHRPMTAAEIERMTGSTGGGGGGGVLGRAGGVGMPRRARMHAADEAAVAESE